MKASRRPSSSLRAPFARRLLTGLGAVAAVGLVQLDSPLHGLHLGASEAEAAYPPSAEGSHVAVATDNGEATRAALGTLARGGNAFDAAITAALTLGVVSPLASGLGGGGFALVYSAKDRKVYALDFRESAPEKLDVEALVGRHKTPDTKEDPKTRGVSVGVPGEPAGLEWLSEHFARKTLAEDAAPAAALAQNGFVLGRNLSEQLAMPFVRAEVAASPALTAAFYPGGVPLAYGAKVKRPEIGQTIAQFGAEGAKPFYHGAIAQELARAVQAAGGTMTEKDFADYKVQMRTPLMREIDGKQVYTMGAPSAGGLMLLETLEMFGASPSSALAKHGSGSSATLHLLAEAMRGAVADRARFASDPTVQKTVEELYDTALDPHQMEARKKRIDARKTTQAPEFRTREHGTSHLIIADDEGNVVSMTTTVNGPMGARIVGASTGIILNDELDDFSAAGDIAGFGLVGLGPNRPRPLARPVSSMTPVIVMDHDQPVLAAGGSGGERIATGVTQAVVGRLIFGLDPGAAVSAPRIHVSTGPELFYDADMAPDVVDGLKARGEQPKEGPPMRPAVQMVAWETRAGGRKLLAASDPRKMGFAAAQ
jgi:gamma-glutamyltranspeptidase/glutathione hydrolase